MSSDISRTRIAVVGVVVTALFAALFARLWYLQVLSAPSYRNAAALNRTKEVQIEPRRGRILDAAGRPLADNRAFPTVLVDRDLIGSTKKRTKLFAQLAPILKVDPTVLDARFKNDIYNRQLPLPVAEDVDQSVVVYLSEHHDEFPAVILSEGSTRIYPYGSLASHILGYVGRITKQELDGQTQGNYNALDAIGKDGVERTFEPYLRGSAGKIEYEVDTAGRTIREINRVDPVPGSDIKLTVNIDIQYLAELSLEQALLERRTDKYLTDIKANPDGKQFNWKAPAGSVVILDPRDSSVLAMASYPTYDQRSFGTISTVDYNRLYNNPDAHGPLTNRALTGLYAPGSTYKLVTAVAGVRNGVVNASEIVRDTATYHIEGCSFDCAKLNAEGVANGDVTLSDAITVSSDYYFYQIGDKLGGDAAVKNFGSKELLQETSREFGFGTATGIALPNEPNGRVPSKKEKEALHDANPEAFTDGTWVTGDNVNMAVGQGLLVVTPLQLTNAYAALANGGQLYQPRIAIEIDRPDGSVQPLLPRKPNGPIPFGKTLVTSAENRNAIIDGMQRVTGEKTATWKERLVGTAADAFVGFRETTKMSIAGKTGTAEVGIDPKSNQDTSLFVGFGPVSDPRFVVSVVMEQSGFGAAAAAPTVRAIFDRLYGTKPLPVLDPVAMNAPMPVGPNLGISFPIKNQTKG